MPRPRNFEQEEKVIELYTECGFTLAEIELHFSIPKLTAYYHLRRNGVVCRKRGSSDRNSRLLPHHLYARARYLYEECYWTFAVIASLEGICEDSARNRVVKAGGKVRGRSESLTPRNRGAKKIPSIQEGTR